MDRFAAANCSDQNNWLMTKSTICPKIPNTTSAPCEAALTRAKSCHAQFQQASIACNSFGQTDSNDPCAVDVLMGVFCVATVNSGVCMATACTYDSDCTTGYKCNAKTDRCFRTDAPCLGLPCSYNSDCPTGHTCNNALSQCVRN